MNMILFEETELQKNLPCSDRRFVHIRDILKLTNGDDFSAGVINGPTGRARLVSIEKDSWRIEFNGQEAAKPFEPLTLILGCPRPPVVRRILKDMTSLGIREFRICRTDLNEKSYLTSRIWRDGLWRDAIIDGAMQAATSLLPLVEIYDSVDKALEHVPDKANRLCLDNSEGAGSFPHNSLGFTEALLAIGPERGWSRRETELFDRLAFQRLHLGERVLRTETACAVGAGLVLSRMGLLGR